MTQRIFDVDNPQDVKDLFALFPDEVQKIMPTSIGFAGIYDKNDKHLETISWLRIRWSKTEITRPVDEAQLVGKLCWFSGSGATCEYIGILKAIVKNRSDKYQMENGGFYSYCRPVCRDEIKFVEDVE